MEISDSSLLINRDWDPSYLSQLVGDQFNDLWNCGRDMNDKELVQNVERIEKYCPIVEDISLDDQVLCTAVEKIEEE